MGKVIDQGNSVRLVGLWPLSAPDMLVPSKSPVLSIWSENGQATIWSIGEDDRPQVLDRLCQLATRIWTNQPLPDHWESKKLESFQTIYVSGRQLVDLRVGYQSRTEKAQRFLDVGSLFLARRQEKSIKVPVPEKSSVSLLDSPLSPPTVEEAQDITGTVAQAEEPADGANLVMDLPTGESHHLFSMKYPEWISKSGPLTKQQRKVISHKVKRPLRIHGPAGSGKTLVLILKALGLLRQAQDESSRSHILIVAHSTAMKGTIKAAVEAIDDRSFMATNKNDSQYLDVETLHGWCIRELGLEHGPRYVLETDPTASGEQQKGILADVMEDALGKRYPGYRNLLSKDFLSRIDGDREQLLRDLGWEIAIRIKGRGFRKGDLNKYLESQLLSFVGKKEERTDRHFIFSVYQFYEERFEELGLLDTDDVVLSMANRLTSPLWDRQRKDFGYDYVMVDETHLFNENERRVLPYLSRGTSESLPLVMTFDEAQSIGGRRSVDLKMSGIENSERQNLTYVHRSSPEIFDLARYFVDNSPLVFSEFVEDNPSVLMSRSEKRRCRKPSVVYGVGDIGILERVVREWNDLKGHNHQRIGIIAFDSILLRFFNKNLGSHTGTFHLVKERGELAAAVPRPGVYLMSPDACGGLEFDAVILVGVDGGRTPPPMGDLSSQGYLSIEEESYAELYTATTRAKYVLTIICDSHRGISPLLSKAVTAGFLVEEDK